MFPALIWYCCGLGDKKGIWPIKTYAAFSKVSVLEEMEEKIKQESVSLRVYLVENDFQNGRRRRRKR